VENVQLAPATRAAITALDDFREVGWFKITTVSAPLI
jgi:hypothetical protein